MREKTYTSFQVAEICGVYPSTVINWVKHGQLRAFTTPGKHRRILEADLLEFLKKYNFPIPAEFAQGRRRVLVVEDDPGVGRLLVKALQEGAPELQVEWQKDGVEALIALGKEPPELVILDTVMPVVDGARVLASLRSDPATSKIRVIAITGKRLPPDKLKYIQKHADAFYLKPFDIKELTQKVLALLGRPAARRQAGAAAV